MISTRFLMVAMMFCGLLAAFVWTTPIGAVESAQAEPEICKTFERFQEKWMGLLAGRGMYGTENLTLEEDPAHKGAYRASFKKLGQVVESKVKKTGNKATPYVGVLKYNEIVYACSGDSPESAKRGPFVEESANTVTEIFRYAKGQWIY